MVTLYFSPGSSSMAVHIALHEVGATFEQHALSLAAKDTRKPDFLAINPNGKVPALVIDGRVLTEVAGCLFYLARAYPQANLLPANDPEAEAQVVSWMSFCASAIHPARAGGPERAREAWLIADQRLGKNEWAVSSRYSIADIHLFRLYWRIRDSGEIKPAEFANVEAHFARMMARPAVKKVIEIEAKIGSTLPR